jgi:hypothetical protein
MYIEFKDNQDFLHLVNKNHIVSVQFSYVDDVAFSVQLVNGKSLAINLSRDEVKKKLGIL